MGVRFGTSLVCLGLVTVLSSCSDDRKPTAPEKPAAAVDGMNASDYGEMSVWFAKRGIVLPEEMPAPDAVAKPAARSVRILGDVSKDGRVSSWDLSVLWYHLRGSTYYANSARYDFDLVDIDRDGDNDWTDLMLLGEYLYLQPRLNLYGIGRALPDDDDDPLRISFNIELVFVEGHGFSESQMELFEEAADRWEDIIVDDVEDRDFKRWPFDSAEKDWWEEYGLEDDIGRVVIKDEVLDDLRVFVTTEDRSGFWGRGGPFWIRGENKLPILGRILIDEDVLTTYRERDGSTLAVMLHELGHVLGFGTIWDDKNQIGNPSIDNPNADTHFKGFRARSAFHLAVRWQGYRGHRVPVENGGDDSHWRESVFGAELMSPRPNVGENPLSNVTIRSLEDLGYEVDQSQADPYRIPAVAAKPVVALGRPFCQVLPLPPVAAHEGW